jgi:hypothetical protein
MIYQKYAKNSIFCKLLSYKEFMFVMVNYHLIKMIVTNADGQTSGLVRIYGYCIGGKKV